MPCKCGNRSTFRDDQTGNLFCSKCNLLLEFDNYDAQIGGISGPTGTNIYIGHAGTGSYYSYKDRKLLEAKTLIHEFTEALELSHLENEVTSMIDDLTEGEFGVGEWFHVLIGACFYVVTRKASKFLPMEEIAEAVPCDVYELGRMISRVSNFLNLNLPEISMSILVEREIGRIPSLSHVDGDVKDRMKKQGILLVNCTVKWFLSTGRRPLPLVAAVITFVAQLNEVKDVKIEKVAKEVRAKAVTSKLRYKELLEALVKVAQVLPWGKDVTVKTVVRHASFIIQYIERKSMQKHRKRKLMPESGQKDSGDAVGECVQINDENRKEGSHEKDNVELLEHGEDDEGTEMCTQLDILNYNDWWSGKSDLSKKLLVKEILEKDVGMSPMPPSFVAGLIADERRRRKICAAKVRINKIMNPSNAYPDESGCSETAVIVSHGKKRKRKEASDIDWEDVIIETLVLHGVKEEEIVKGHYKRLMDLHVFNSGEI